MSVFADALINRARRAIRFDRRERGLVLLYHRVAAPASDPQRLAVQPEIFDRQLAFITLEADVMPLEELMQRARDESLPRRAAAVTFDDGYADVLHHARPMLAAHRVPVTVFVTSDAVIDGEFWWDAIERVLLEPGTLPEVLQLTIGATTIRYDLGAHATYDDGDAAAHRAWHVEQPGSPTPRHSAYRDLCARLRTQPRDVRARVVADLSALCRATPPCNRALTPAEVASLHRMDGVTVGSHTRSHAALSALPEDEQTLEIAAGRRQLEQWIGASSTLFAYPFGGRSEVSRQSAAAARVAGITVACTTESGHVDASTDHLRVPRMTMRNWSESAFRSRWTEWTAQ